MILAHHEQFVLMLIAGGIVCFRWLFPMLGKAIMKLNQRLQNRIAQLKKQEGVWEKNVVREFENDVQNYRREYEL